MKRYISLFLLVLMAGSIIFFQSVNAEDNGFTPAEEWGSVNGEVFFTGDDGEIFTVKPSVTRTNNLENVTNTGSITVVQDALGLIENGGTVLNGVAITVTAFLPAGDNYLFIGNTYGCNSQGKCTGTWLPNATITGADGCSIVNNGLSTQMHCPSVGTNGQTITLTGSAVKPNEAPPIVIDPNVTIATNPTPSGGDFTQWNGIWGTTLHLPIITNP